MASCDTIKLDPKSTRGVNRTNKQKGGQKTRMHTHNRTCYIKTQWKERDQETRSPTLVREREGTKEIRESNATKYDGRMSEWLFSPFVVEESEEMNWVSYCFSRKTSCYYFFFEWYWFWLCFVAMKDVRKRDDPRSQFSLRWTGGMI